MFGRVEIVTFVIDHQIEDRALWEARWFIDDQATILHSGS